jgi:hypothetical protein
VLPGRQLWSQFLVARLGYSKMQHPIMGGTLWRYGTQEEGCIDHSFIHPSIQDPTRVVQLLSTTDRPGLGYPNRQCFVL